ncbi:MAG TPA: LptA/OstA family protein [Gammaproteobacteria bacterium]|nr:LptA/OstA family protein [Gammaproteobacteria bacterium]
MLPKILHGCALALTVSLAAGAQNDAGDAELQFTSGPFVLDGPTNMMRAQAPRLIQGDLRIQADDVLVTALEFEEAGEFRLTGNVRIDVGTTFMEADSAVFTYAQGRLSRGVLEGTPVTFTDIDDATQTSVTGTAGKISYDNVAGTLRMTGNASVVFPTREVIGCDLVYNFNTERATAGSADCEGGFRFILRRDSEERAAVPAPPQ